MNDPRQPQLFHPIVKIIKGVQWKTEGATMIAFHLNTVLYRVENYLMRTPSGNYFIQEHIHGGKHGVNEIHPIDLKKAIKKYQEFEVKYLPPDQAFPDMRQA